MSSKMGFVVCEKRAQGKPGSVYEIQLTRLPRNGFHFLFYAFIDLPVLP